MTTTKQLNNSQDKMSPMDNRTVLYYEGSEWLLEPVPRGEYPIIVTFSEIKDPFGCRGKAIRRKIKENKE